MIHKRSTALERSIRSCTFGKLVNAQTKDIKLLFVGKIIFVSVASLMALGIYMVKGVGIWTDGWTEWTDDAKTIAFQLRRGIRRRRRRRRK